MEPRWIVEVPDVEAFMELLEDRDLEQLVVEILERANLSADVTWDDDGVTVISAGKQTTYDLSGDELADVIQSALELAAHLVAEHGFVLASAGFDSLQIAVVPRLQWNALPENARNGYSIVEPRARPARPQSPRPSRIMN